VRQIELNRATFRRLVQLYVAFFLLTIAIIAAELMNSRWWTFSEEFDALVARIFGVSGVDTFPIASLVVLLGLLVWMIASMIGLFWYRRWARFGSWASIIALFGAMFVIDGYRPSYTSPLLNMLTLVDGALFGAIILLSYAKGFGAGWFRWPLEVTEE